MRRRQEGGGAPSPIESWMEAAGRVPLLTAAEELHLGAAIQRWQQHEGGPDKAPPAIRRAGLRARDRMVAANLRLVGHVVMRSRTRLAFDDACQSAAIGLQRAAEKFDPTRGYKFSTYAYWWIRQAVSRADEDMGATIRAPNHIQQKLVRLNRVSNDLHQKLGRSPTMAELAEASGLEPRLMRELLDRGRYCLSLDLPVGDGGVMLGELLADDRGEDALERIDESLAVDRLRAGLAQLASSDPDGAALVAELFGLDGGEPSTLEAAGKRRKRTREAMRLARNRAMVKLRGLLLRQELQEQGHLDLYPQPPPQRRGPPPPASITLPPQGLA